MNLKKAIEIYNKYQNDNIIKDFEEARSIILEEHKKRKPEKILYGSSKLYDYYIEQPYEEMIFTNEGIEFRKHYYNGIGKSKNGKSRFNLCLSLCKYSKEKIMTIIDKYIKEDNLKEE